MKVTYKYILTLAILVLGGLGAQAQLKVGNNPTTIDPSAVLEAESTNKGFLPPRVNLTSATDAATIPSPASGLIVYNVSGAVGVAGIYVNTGTPAAPKWSLISVQTSIVGSAVFKQPLIQASPAVELNAGDLSFRYSSTATSGVWQVKYNGAGLRNISVMFIEHWDGGGYASSAVGTTTLSSGSWANIPPGSSVGSALELNVGRIYDLVTGITYRFEGQLTLSSGLLLEGMICERF